MMEDGDLQDQRRDNARTLKWITLAIVAIIAIVFVTKNSHTVTVSYIFDTVETPLIWALLAALVLGFLSGWLTGSFRRSR